MDPLRSAHTPQAPAQPATFISPTSTLAPSSTLNSTISHPANPFNPHPSNSTTQPFAAASHPISACAAESTMSQTQPFAQALGNTSHPAGIPLAPQGHNSESQPRSDVPPATQPADVLPQAGGNGLGGPTATAPFLQDFSLVAEAAKRAQMSIVMRDLESVTL
ncbi:hypothetical protein N7533_000768 [Penicillium manginii]|uniref:uncharacterized protein n=1 Tax=Penicillium manginii TaxID=203109 RepID=UPI0025499495|nr:uncharacterized protein N7533_000768 [Penicillium manginii]KAJ5768185.1 hypothetical protein N7533_000768 [Penicillium manginii]